MKNKKVLLPVIFIALALIVVITLLFPSKNTFKSDLLTTPGSSLFDAAFKDYGIAFTSMNIKSGVTLMNAAGEHVYYGEISGNPQMKFFKFNLDKRTVEQEIYLDALDSWKVVSYKGKIYIGTVYPACLYEYSVDTGTMKLLTTLKANLEYIWDLAVDDDNVYMGTYDGEPYRYEFATGKTISLGANLSQAKSSRSIAVLNGKVYIGFGGPHKDGSASITEIIEEDWKTGEINSILPAEYHWPDAIPGNLNIVDNKLILSMTNTLIVRYDPLTKEWKGLYNGGTIPNPPGMAPTSASGTELFSGYIGNLYEYDKTKPSYADLAQVSPVGIWSRQSGAFINDQKRQTMVTYDGDVMDIDFTGKIISRYNLSDYKLSGSVTVPYSMAAYKNKIAIGQTRIRIFDISTQEEFYKSLNSEPKVMTFMSGSLLTANYAAADIWKYPFSVLQKGNTDDFRDPALFRSFFINDYLPKENGQVRPKGITASGSRLLISTEPAYGAYGGAFSYYNDDTKEHYAFANIVPKHTIEDAAFDDTNTRYAYIGTSAYGGTQATPLSENAHMVKWDLIDKKVVWDVIPIVPASGAPFELLIKRITKRGNYVYALSDNGTMLQLDSETGTVVKKMLNSNYTDFFQASNGVIYVASKDGLGIMQDDLSMNLIKTGMNIVFNTLTEDLDTKLLYFVNDRNLVQFNPVIYKGILHIEENKNVNLNSNQPVQNQNVNNGDSNLVNSNLNVIVNLNMNQSVTNTNVNFEENLNVNKIQTNLNQSTIMNINQNSSLHGVSLNQSTITNINQNSLLHGVSFPDIGGHFAASYITALAAHGIVQGRPSGNFEPNAILNRAEATKLVVKAFLSTEDDQKFMVDFKGLHGSYTYVYFKDVLVNTWYAGFVGLAKEKNVVSGMVNGTFEPGRAITRAEFLKITLEGKQVVLRALSDAFHKDHLLFEDVKPEDWFSDYVYAAAELGIIDSKPQFAPNRTITRGEAAKIIYKTMAVE